MYKDLLHQVVDSWVITRSETEAITIYVIDVCLSMISQKSVDGLYNEAALRISKRFCFCAIFHDDGISRFSYVGTIIRVLDQ